METMLTTPQLADKLGLSRSTVYKLIERGMPTRKIGGARRFVPSEVEKWLAK